MTSDMSLNSLKEKYPEAYEVFNEALGNVIRILHRHNQQMLFEAQKAHEMELAAVTALATPKPTEEQARVSEPMGTCDLIKRPHPQSHCGKAWHPEPMTASEMLESIIGSLRGYPNHGGDVRVMAEVERIVQLAKVPESATPLKCAVCGNGLGSDGHPSVTRTLHFEPNFRRAMEKASLVVTEPYPMCDRCYHKGIWMAQPAESAKGPAPTGRREGEKS